ncbi:MAG: N-acetyl-gamma-glutamyl-phosphate reductase, partial [Clostridia bacterium]|nr:N-acetyl-gamma-glutamyl-phosphate reductase [Clostridia bacterium]
MKKVFIDGSAGTTGLRIYERLSVREDVKILSLPDEKRKDPIAKKEIVNQADVVFLCLPDDAARESVSLVENPNTVVIDASTAHRTLSDWAYGFPELSKIHEEKILSSKRIAVPGCHASGFIALVYPLVEAGILGKDALVTCHSITGYSGGGKKMIAEYEGVDRNLLLNAPRQYALTQNHKHLKEMKAITGLENEPAFSPIVSDFYSGMVVTVPLFKKQLNKGGRDEIIALYKTKYDNEFVRYEECLDESGF